MTYEKAKNTAFAKGLVPNGFNGHTAEVKFGLINRVVITITGTGYFKTGLPDTIDKAEAFWLLKHHPSSTAKQVELI